MKFLGKAHMKIMWIILFACAIWLEIEFIKLFFVAQQQQKTFPCTYITGTCTVKPTYENCLEFGNIPKSQCERLLNSR